MHIADVKEAVATGAAGMVIELGYVPAHVIIKNVTQGTQVEYINPTVGLSAKAVADGLVTPVFADGTYIGVAGTKVTDNKLRRTDPGSLGVKAQNGEGLILDDIATVNDTADDELVVIAYRGDL